jgi:quinol monooxygenase YgiN
MMPDPSQLVIARVHGLASASAELTAAAGALAESCGAQEGCLGFDVLVTSGSRSELILMSGWRSDQEMRAHFASAAYADYVSAVTHLLARPSDVAIHRIAATLHPIADLSSEPQRAS